MYGTTFVADLDRAGLRSFALRGIAEFFREHQLSGINSWEHRGRRNINGKTNKIGYIIVRGVRYYHTCYGIACLHNASSVFSY